MAVVAGEAKGESTKSTGWMSIGLTEELNGRIPVAFSSWGAGFTSHEKFSRGNSVPGTGYVSSAYADVFLYVEGGYVSDHEQGGLSGRTWMIECGSTFHNQRANGVS